jgi:hypothetical protein
LTYIDGYHHKGNVRERREGEGGEEREERRPRIWMRDQKARSRGGEERQRER